MSAAIVVGMSGLTMPVPAQAIEPPGIDPGALNAAIALNAKGGPPDPTVQRLMCAELGLSGTPPQETRDLPALWRLSRGAGQKVAVIDTGVNRHPRLPKLQAGGDFVANSDGTSDCDAHGTLIAGIIAAQPSSKDSFAGIAPDATILSIRQLSLAYQAANGTGATPGQMYDGGYGSVLTLAASVVRAVDMGATVIDIPEPACAAADGPFTDGALGAAVRYAFDRNVVVVTAAGDVQAEGHCAVQNDGTGWKAVRTVASPAWFGANVLTVASTDANGSVSPHSLHGPWVGVAAPGQNVVSLDSAPGATGLVNTAQTAGGQAPIEGTGFSSAYVAGLAALVRARFPGLTAAQVIERIEKTAKHPGSGRDDAVGYGAVDPIAALGSHSPANTTNVVAITVISVLAALVIGLAVRIPFRRRRSRPA